MMSNTALLVTSTFCTAINVEVERYTRPFKSLGSHRQCGAIYSIYSFNALQWYILYISIHSLCHDTQHVAQVLFPLVILEMLDWRPPVLHSADWT